MKPTLDSAAAAPWILRGDAGRDAAALRSRNVHRYVGLQFKPEYEKNYLLAPDGSLITSVPGLKEVLGDKEAFARLWRSCAARAAELRLDAAATDALCSFTTPAVDRPSGIDVGPVCYGLEVASTPAFA